VPRWRKLGFAAALAVLVGIEAVAREVMFGILAANLLFLYLHPTWRHRGYWLSFAAYAGLFALQLGLGPLGRAFN